ncbi:MAG: 16S rRNA (cytosine(1402)-N(4))-methyltransferase RsmH [Peptococcaceae bacterium]|nr:16S rRNA (cytosine(1402)-N(4))-methyltransferase RsmH [Peptococcaceae bacterium]
MEFCHRPVLLDEVLDLLELKPGMTVMDCTAGGGGHSLAMLREAQPGGRLIALDQDEDALAATRTRLSAAGMEGRFTLVHQNFSRLEETLAELGGIRPQAILMDLGVSSFQLDEAKRGFSYMQEGPLDMRMDQTAGGTTAAELVNTAAAAELEKIIRRYGEERWSKRIAEFIVAERQQKPIETTGRLVEVIKKAIPAGARQEGPHPAKRTFQALRIAVNGELEILEAAVASAVEALAPGGRLAVITFHSLEDRIVKTKMKELAAGCTCPPDLPVCICGKSAKGKVLTGKPILPSQQELAENPRARSAKLRGFRKSEKPFSEMET